MTRTASSKPKTDSLDPPTPMTRQYVENLMDHFRQQKKLKISQVNSILAQVRKKLETIQNIVEITVTDGKELTIVGDTHGQYYDVLNLFTLNGVPHPDNPYVVNGDWVDRGSFGTEICLLFFCFKLLYPQSFHLLRGNHECSMCTKEYGFKNEVEDKYNGAVYQNFLYIFNALPICCIINQRIFITHGGLFTKLNVTLDSINKVNRFNEPGEEGGDMLMAQMLWSDPMEMNGMKASIRPYGCSFGPDITNDFLDRNNLQMIIRSHEVRPEGYSVEHGGRLITLFSAPNYMQETNKGAYLRLVGAEVEIHPFQFTAISHPPVKLYYDPNSCNSM